MPRPPGRPKGDVATEVIAVRVPIPLRERLDRYLDRLAVREGVNASRSAMIGHALEFFLNHKEQEVFHG